MYMILGLTLALAGCVSVYLASPNQRWLDHSWRPHPALAAGVLLLAAGVAALWQAMQPVAAVFTAFAWVMLLFVLFPYLGAWLSLQRIR